MALGPKKSSADFSIVNNTYVVRNGLFYEYYSISCKSQKEGSNFIEFDLSPAILQEGTAIVNKKLYAVSVLDLFRRRIDVRKEIEHSSTSRAKSKQSKSTVAKLKAQPNSEQQPFSDVLGDQVNEDANLAWENQVSTLLETLHSKEGEEWEITGTIQPRSTDEDSSVSDIFEDSI